MSQMEIMEKKMMERKEIEKESIFKKHEILRMALSLAIYLGLFYVVMNIIFRVQPPGIWV